MVRLRASTLDSPSSFVITMRVCARVCRNFSGFFVSDCGGIDDAAHEAFRPASEVALKAVRAGTDMECTDDWPGDYARHLPAAVVSGALDEHVIDTALSRVLRVLMELGELDAEVPWRRLGPEVVGSKEHVELARLAAEESIVLLQNNATALACMWHDDRTAGQLSDGKDRSRGDGEPCIKPVLPLPTDRQLKVAIVGPMGKATVDLLGEIDYVVPASPQVQGRSLVDVFQSDSAVTRVTYSEGCSLRDNCNDTSAIPDAVDAVRDADVVVFVVGLLSCDRAGRRASECESEGHDRSGVGLPGSTGQLVEAVSAAAPQAARIALLVHGGALAIEPLIANCHAVLDAHHPGEVGALAVVDALFGRLNPSARLPYTVYPVDFTTHSRPSMTDVRLRGGPSTDSLPPSDGVTYWYYRGSPLFAFGHGLSYTTFTFAWAADANSSQVDAVRKVTVTNVAGPPGSTVVLGFVSASHLPMFPLLRLFDFARTPVVSPGESVAVPLQTSWRSFALTDASGATDITPGRFELATGDPGPEMARVGVDLR